MSIQWRLVTRDDDEPVVNYWHNGMNVDLYCQVIDVGPLDDGDWAVTLEIKDMDI